MKPMTGPSGGSNAKRVRMICNDCQAQYTRNRRAGKVDRGFRGRYTLKHGNYKTVKKWCCPHCDGTNVRSDEKNRRIENSKDRCDCQPIPFRHNKKSPPIGCEHHWKDYDDWTDEDHEQYEHMMRTPRSG